jgi:hypothetical protein
MAKVVAAASRPRLQETQNPMLRSLRKTSICGKRSLAARMLGASGPSSTTITWIGWSLRAYSDSRHSDNTSAR